MVLIQHFLLLLLLVEALVMGLQAWALEILVALAVVQ